MFSYHPIDSETLVYQKNNYEVNFKAAYILKKTKYVIFPNHD